MVAFSRAAQRIGIAGALGITLACSVAYNLLVLLPSYREILALRIAALAAILLASFGWAILVGLTARKRNWSSAQCFRFSALSLMILGPANALLLSYFVPLHPASYTVFFAMAPFFGAIAQKIAFPELKSGDRQTDQLTILHLN